MTEFNYTAVDKEGKERKGSIEADSLNEALSRIRQRGLYPANVAVARENKTASSSPLSFLSNLSFSRKSEKIGAQEMVIFTRQLSVLLNAGLPLVKALHTLKKQKRFEFMSAVIGGIADTIESGKTFSDALAHYPSSFSRVYVNLIKAGETGGALDQVLMRLADFLEKNLRLRQKIRSALIYPCLVLCVSVAILSFVIIFVIPKFTEMFKNIGAVLPLITRIIVKLSYLLVHRWYLGIGAIIALVVIYRLALLNSRFRYLRDKALLNFPVIGGLVQKIAASRFARTLSTLLSGGVPILRALELTQQISGNEVISKTVGEVADAVREGNFISRVLESNEVFPQLMVNMIAVGEETGSLDKMLAKVAETYEEEVEITTANLTALLEPVLVIFMGVVVGLIVLSMFLPLISLIQNLST